MRLVRIVVPIAVALLVTSVAFYLSQLPHPYTCAGGGFSVTNFSQGNGTSIYPNASITTVAFGAGDSVRYQWTLLSGGGASFYLQAPDGSRAAIVGTDGGSGSFVAESGIYAFGLTPAPPTEMVQVAYTETCTS